MKRPLAVTGFMYLASQIIAVHCGAAVSVTLFFVLLCSLVMYLALVRERKSAAVAMLLSAAVCFGAYSVYSLGFVRPAETLEGRELLITAKVTDQPYYANNRWYYYVKTESVGAAGVPQRIKLRLSMAESCEAQPDDMISCYAVFNRTDTDRASELRLRSRGALVSAYVDKYGAQPEVARGKQTLRGRMILMRQRLIRRIKTVFGGEYSALLTGMLLGDTSYMDDRLIRMFRLCGISHYLAVSGLHLSVVSYAADKLLTVSRVPLRPRSAILPAFILFFIALTGFSVSAVRAGIMLSIYYIGRAVIRDDDPLNSLGAAVLAVCVIRPYAAADVGLLLSVSCVLGLLILRPKLKSRILNRLKACERFSGRINRRAAALLDAVLVPAVASVSVFPVSALYFGEYSLISVPMNLLCLYPASGLIVLGAAAVLLSAVPLIGSALSFVFLIPAKACAWLLMKLAAVCSRPSWVSVNVNYRCLPVLMLCCTVLAAAGYLLFRGRDAAVKRRTTKLLALFVAAAAAVSVIAENIYDRSRSELIVFDVGGGTACCARSKGEYMLFGAGGDTYKAWKMTGQLDRMKITALDALVLSGDSEEIMSYSDEITRMYRPKSVYLAGQGVYGDALVYACEQERCPLYYADGGASWSGRRGGTGFELTADGDGRMWGWITAGGLTALAVPEGGDCSALPDRYRSPDVVILGSESIINPSALDAALFIVSADGRSAAGCEAMLRYRGIKNVISTARGGSLRVTGHNGGIKVEEMDDNA